MTREECTLKLLLLVNSSASSVTARGRVVIQKALGADHDVTLAETTRRNHATRLARQAAHDGIDVVVVLGGDGTLNEAANGLAGTSTALAPLPGGSTNVFARQLGLPDDPIEATGVTLESLAAGRLRPIGLGAVNGRYFLFHVGVGFDAAVVAQVERRSTFKRWASHPLFVYAGFDTWFRHYDTKRPHFAVHHADGTVVDDGYFTIVFNSNPYTYLGSRPLNIAPEATLDRPLAAMTLRTLGFAPFITLILSSLGTGARIRRDRRVDYRHDVTSLEIEAYGGVPYQVDGDFLGEASGLSFRWEPDALRLVHPA
jgi:diacylglycerol kinase family enzyme